MVTLLVLITLVYPDGHTWHTTMSDSYHHSCQMAVKDVTFQLEQTLSVAKIQGITCEEGI